METKEEVDEDLGPPVPRNWEQAIPRFRSDWGLGSLSGRIEPGRPWPDNWRWFHHFDGSTRSDAEEMIASERNLTTALAAVPPS